MENNYPIQVFIAWSQSGSKEVAEILHDFFKELYAIHIENKKLQFYFSETNLAINEVQPQILEKLRNASLGIFVLTPLNENKPWLMYEAGAISANARNGVVVPFLFCRNKEKIEPQFTNLRYFIYEAFETKDKEETNLKEFTNFLIKINLKLATFNVGLPENLLKYCINNIWNESLSNKLHDIAITHLTTQENLAVYLENRLNKPLSPRTLPDFFADNMKLLFSEKENFFKQDNNEKKWNSHRIVFGSNLRISSFVAFIDTSGRYILLFKRTMSKHTEIHNNEYDVFGSKQFENRGLIPKIKPDNTNLSKENKLKLDEFLDSSIEKIVPIHGVALEKNAAIVSDNNENVAMLGIFAYMPLEKLQMACANNNALVLKDISIPIEDNTIDEYTSKAWLSIKQLSCLFNKQA